MKSRKSNCISLEQAQLHCISLTKGVQFCFQVIWQSITSFSDNVLAFISIPEFYILSASGNFFQSRVGQYRIHKNQVYSFLDAVLAIARGLKHSKFLFDYTVCIKRRLKPKFQYLNLWRYSTVKTIVLAFTLLVEK